MPSPSTGAPRLENVTLKVDADALLWARTRALFAGTSINAVIRTFIDAYAAVPQRFKDGLPPPWTEARYAYQVFREIVEPAEAGEAARTAGDGGDLVAEVIAEVTSPDRSEA